MGKVIAFAGSNSKNSINKKLATFAASLLKSNEFKVLDLNDYELPLYSIDVEVENEFPEAAIKFNNELAESDAVIISLAEHNGSYTAAFKNLLDWVSRKDKTVFKNKPVLVLATSPGGRGGATVLNTALNSFPHFGADIKGSFSLPSFNDNFKEDKIVDSDLLNQLSEAVKNLESAL
ncbi:NADPH-dependent FMN reductase [Tenacibaculum jejuense]|uniref:NADPH-dependent FMN reductase n=1 Tax=Tenacibaculum jejuense TaxID=584609 RepID=A0A238U7G4_9FLAO|nr:NAD(P)H-dependent oxidoreductase [Tenacibaculum jejuense]SNR15123.1 NADPH-dependent FMN reductase [Tenacibaculum jejuense]